MAMYRGLRAIAKRMGWKSPMTPLRHHEKYDDPKLCFPLVMFPTGKGLGFVWVTDDALIELWMQRMSEKSAHERVTRPKLPRRRKVPLPKALAIRQIERIARLADMSMDEIRIRIGGTGEPTYSRGEKPPLHEELRWDTLQPGEKAYVKARELTPEELEEIERYEAKKRTETTAQPERKGAQPRPQVATPQPRITNPIAEVSRRVANRHFEQRKRSRG